MNRRQFNFGRNVSLSPRIRYDPRSENEVLKILDRHKGQRFRCVGRLHSWSRVLDCDDVLIDLRHLKDVQVFSDGDEKAVQVGAGCQIKHLLSELDSHGLTLPSVGFITEQTIAGAVSTGTHGSGRHSLSHYVSKIRIARYDQESGNAVVEEISTGEHLRAARCSLGALGVIVSVTMNCRPTYRVEEHFEEYRSLSDVLEAEREYPLQQFYLVPWRWTLVAQHRREVNLPNSKASILYRWYRFVVLDIAMHLLIFAAVWIVRIPAVVRALFRSVLTQFVLRNCRFVEDSSKQLVMEHELFRHVELELFVRQDQLEPALTFLQDSLRAAGDRTFSPNTMFQSLVTKADCAVDLEQITASYCHHYPICVRKILAEGTLISMATNACRAQPQSAEAPEEAAVAWYSITLTNYHRGTKRRAFENVAAFLAKSMARLFMARPHWGKICPLPIAELQSLYPGIDRFREICVDADPEGHFSNDWTLSLLRTKPNYSEKANHYNE